MAKLVDTHGMYEAETSKGAELHKENNITAAPRTRLVASHINHGRLLCFADIRIMELRQNVMDVISPEDLTHEMNTEDLNSVWYNQLYENDR